MLGERSRSGTDDCNCDWTLAMLSCCINTRFSRSFFSSRASNCLTFCWLLMLDGGRYDRCAMAMHPLLWVKPGRREVEASEQRLLMEDCESLLVTWMIGNRIKR
jgi:hypothetical protein